MDKISVRRKQIEVAAAMINLNSDWLPDFKFLIYDAIGENIIAPLFSVEELKNNNVVLHLPLHSKKRSREPFITAVYFVMPTEENIERICQDLKHDLYDSYYFNFISAISRPKLDQIAITALNYASPLELDSVSKSDSKTKVKKVYDQYLNFIALEDDLFILRESEKQLVSYYAINRNDATDLQIAHVIDYIVDCLFSLLVTLNIIPIMRTPKGGPAELIAEKLTKKIRETLNGNNNLFANQTTDTSTASLSFQRPLLCLVDRTIDMSTPLHHTWTYQALIHDLLNTELNKVKVTEQDKGKSATTGAKPKVQIYDLNPNDKFWRDQRGSPFPQVAEAVQKELDDYKKHEVELTRGLNGGGPDDEGGLSLADSAAKLTNAVSSLPELRENKRVIEKHTSIATAVLDEIKTRKLDNFFELEEKIMNRNLIDRATLDEMIAQPDYGQPSDKYRLFLICYICDNPTLTEEEAEKYVTVLESMGCKRTAYEYIKKWKTFSRINVASLQSSLQSSGGLLKSAGMFSKLMSQGSQFVMEGVKNLVLKEHFLPLTKIVDGLMDCSSKASEESLKYTYFDPKSRGDHELQRKKVFQTAIVFVVGGGNYIEYQNLVDYCKSKSRNISGASGTRHVIYGSTDFVNATQFLEQLDLAGSS